HDAHNQPTQLNHSGRMRAARGLRNKMPSDQFAIDRRSFIKAAAPFALAAPAVIRGQVLIERGLFSSDDVPLARQQLLEMVNAERRQHGLTHLELDDLACRVAAEHALDMTEGQFL